MPRNGSGVYSLPGGSTVTNGDTSDATDINTPLEDLVTDANTARPIVAGGTGATSAAAALVNFGVTSTAAELNILDGVTATASELNALDGITATVTELNYTDGVTSAIQAQLDAKAALASPALTGTPTAPTAATTTDTTQVATTAFVQQEIEAQVGIQARALYDGVTPAAVVDSGFSSISRSATGVYSFTFSTAQADNEYLVFAARQDAPTSSASVYAQVRSKTTTGFEVRTGFVNAGSDGAQNAVFAVTVERI